MNNLRTQFEDYAVIQTMSQLCVGGQHENMGDFSKAIKAYTDGKQFAEAKFGTKHQLYTQCLNAIGGARLKSKYQIKEVIRSNENIVTVPDNNNI